jgi:phenylpyruvate tautomerase PptA (4-oxalocrotonate tautomerase family)
MPVSYIDIPSGVSTSAKEKLVKEVYDAIHEAWPIPDTRILLREWPDEAVSQDGRMEKTPMRPI